MAQRWEDTVSAEELQRLRARVQARHNAARGEWSRRSQGKSGRRKRASYDSLGLPVLSPNQKRKAAARARSGRFPDNRVLLNLHPGRAWTLDELGDNPATVYALVDPGDQTVRYIGKTVDPFRRYDEHKAARWQGNPELHAWLTSLKPRGPTIIHVDRVPGSMWARCERRWIAWARRFGRLYNIEDGGPSPRKRRG